MHQTDIRHRNISSLGDESVQYAFLTCVPLEKLNCKNRNETFLYAPGKYAFASAIYLERPRDICRMNRIQSVSAGVGGDIELL